MNRYIKKNRPKPPDGCLFKVGDVARVYRNGRPTAYTFMIRTLTSEHIFCGHLRFHRHNLLYVGNAEYSLGPVRTTEPLMPPTL